MDGQGRTQVQYLCPGTTLDSDTCGDQCDMQQLCSALCVCEPLCGAGEVNCVTLWSGHKQRNPQDYFWMSVLYL